MAKNSRGSFRGTVLTKSSPALAEKLASALEQELESLRERLQRATAAAAVRPGKRRTPIGRAPDRAPRPASSGADATTATATLSRLRARGKTTAKLVRGSVVRPGTGGLTPHTWVEVDDEVHDATLGDGRRVWPIELYYLVFHPVKQQEAA